MCLNHGLLKRGTNHFDKEAERGPGRLILLPAFRLSVAEVLQEEQHLPRGGGEPALGCKLGPSAFPPAPPHPQGHSLGACVCVYVLLRLPRFSPCFKWQPKGNHTIWMGSRSPSFSQLPTSRASALKTALDKTWQQPGAERLQEARGRQPCNCTWDIPGVTC